MDGWWKRDFMFTSRREGRDEKHVHARGVQKSNWTGQEVRPSSLSNKPIE
jgi:hypothetical protein